MFNLKEKKYLNWLWITVIIFLILVLFIYNFKTFWNVFFPILYLIGFLFIFFVLPKFISTKLLFKTKLFWYYPIMGLGFFIFIVLYRSSIRGINFSDFSFSQIPFPLYLLFFGAVFAGYVYGAIDRLKLKGLDKKNILAESLGFSFNNIDKTGVLYLTHENDIVFLAKDFEGLKFKCAEIQSISVLYEYNIFPACININLTTNNSYKFFSSFPYVWKKEILKIKNK